MTNNFEDDFDLNQEGCTLQPGDLKAGEQRNPIDESAPAESIEISTDEVADAENGAGERPTTEPSTPPAQVSPAHSMRGRIAHFMGALVAALIGKQIGADRPEKFANHHVLDGHSFQIWTISGSQNMRCGISRACDVARQRRLPDRSPSLPQTARTDWRRRARPPSAIQGELYNVLSSRWFLLRWPNPVDAL